MGILANGLIAAFLALGVPATAHARSSGSHNTSHSDITIGKSTDKGSTKLMSRDAASGLPTGKRMHKPVAAASKSTKVRATPEKVEAGSENVR